MVFLNPYHTADAAVSLHDALGVGVAGAGLSVGAEPEVLATFDLVADEAGFTVPAAEGALGETTQTEEYEGSSFITEVGKPRPGGRLWPDGLYNPAQRAFTIIFPNCQIEKVISLTG